ncbi:AlkA N-terminal domain-containing protein [Pokkaliibacter sp. MBI-7]|uniref:DNA-3-methyladenine glycosylase 2 n=1 Tax=Pokkaliibacter sp. MBI-7 TaxID=3040600 RepID=UPI00244C20B0|nr:AlkA N-terminal domain-containing protein [Pokkaliibacter sp. MBI-7]MDH2431339.1 AlkA N-terminal domain-containing protein [Pokkaliibacter sp. MBI-7]
MAVISNKQGAAMQLSIALPENFRRQDFLAFHRRDADQLSEHVTEDSLLKGVVWQGQPACLSLFFTERNISVTLDSDTACSADGQRTLEAWVRHMLGLNQPVAHFEQHFAADPVVGPLLQRQAGLRVPQSASAFEAVAWAIIGQQISVSVAIAVRRKLIQHADLRHTSGLFCHPDALAVARMDEEQLRSLGFSRSKAIALLGVARDAELVALLAQPVVTAAQAEAVSCRLLAVKGIGPWTVSYALLRGFGWLDGSLHGDVAVRRNLQQLLQRPEKISDKETAEWLQAFSPWRALMAAHLWAQQSSAGY